MKTNKEKFSRWLGIAVVALVTFFLVRQGFQFLANSGLSPLVRVVPFGKTGATSLIVVVHAYQGSIQTMADVQKVIEQSRPNAEILMVEYPARTWSNADCFQIASNLCEKINERYQTNHYASIEFVGYSLGALLARKSYVYACGKTEDLNSDPDAPPETRPAYAWATNGTVKRFILFAGMNRGWTTRNRPSGMRSWHQFVFISAKFIAWATGTGHLIRQCETGEPFVANLRMQWLEASREQPKANRPTVIQLLGDTDDIVSSEDSRDANVARDFIWVQLAGTGHFNATKFHTGLKTKEVQQFGLARERKFKEALADEQTNKRLLRASPRTPEADDTEVVEAVVVLHGIRDFGEWTSEFEDALQERFMNKHPQTEKLCIYRPKYGYFPMGRFLLWPERQKKVRWFMDEITELQAKYPNLKRLHFIGHSNGTYILASALRRYKALKMVKRVVFAGSVVPQSFDWTSPGLSNRVESVRSYAGSSDLVVGWFPRLFEIWPFTKLGGDIGSAGFNGFTKPGTMTSSTWTALTNTFLFQTTFVKGAHATAIESDTNKIDSIAAFVMDKKVIHPAATVPVQSPLIASLSVVAPVVWLLILCLLRWGGIAAARFPRWLKNKVAKRRSDSQAGPTAMLSNEPRWLSYFDEVPMNLRWIQLTIKTKAISLMLYALFILFLLLKY